MLTTPKPLDFVKVEALRKHMLLTVKDMSELLGVSRMTYYGWLRGKTIRKKNEEATRRMLRKMLTLVRDHHWPPPEVIAANQDLRKKRVTEELQRLQ
jgi:DNA-binding transcriptional regulator YiaG